MECRSIETDVEDMVDALACLVDLVEMWGPIRCWGERSFRVKIEEPRTNIYDSVSSATSGVIND